MSDLIEIVKQITTAWQNKDEAAIRSLLHEDYHFKGPMMEMHGIEACIKFMHTCQYESSNKNCEAIVEGDKLVHIFDWEVTAPFQATIPMVEILEFVNGKVKNSRMFFDTAQFPAEFMEQMEQGCETA